MNIDGLGTHHGNNVPQTSNFLPPQQQFYYAPPNPSQVPNNFNHIVGFSAPTPVPHYDSSSQPQVSHYESAIQPQAPQHEPAPHYSHRPKTRSHHPPNPYTHKRYGPNLNSLHAYSSGPKQSIGLSAYQDNKASFTVQPSIDLTEHHQQALSSNSLLSTASPLVVSTYGPPKPVEFHYKRPSSSSSHVYPYHRHKGKFIYRVTATDKIV